MNTMAELPIKDVAQQSRRRNDPHVGAALWIPHPRAHKRIPLLPGRRRGAAPGPGLPPPRPVRASAIERPRERRRVRPSFDLRRGRLRAQGSARRCCESTLVALSRAIEREAIAHAAAPVLIGAFQRERLLPGGRPPARAERRRGRRLRRLRAGAQARRRAGRDPDRRGECARTRGPSSSTPRDTPPACWRGSGAA